MHYLNYDESNAHVCSIDELPENGLSVRDGFGITTGTSGGATLSESLKRPPLSSSLQQNIAISKTL